MTSHVYWEYEEDRVSARADGDPDSARALPRAENQSVRARDDRHDVLNPRDGAIGCQIVYARTQVH
mgnify:CR=1 FL=1